jgi:hypothetical protein
MTVRSVLLLSGAILAMAGARPLRAQTDTTLVRALSAVLADSLLGGRISTKPIIWIEAKTPFELATARSVANHPRLRGPVRDPDHLVWVRLARVEREADTTSVVVEFGQTYADSGTFTFWREQWAFLFIPAPSGWQFVRKQFLRHGDGGPVRG